MNGAVTLFPALLMLVVTVIGSGSALFFKLGSASFTLRPSWLLRQRKLFIGGVLFLLSAGLYLYVLRILPLSVAYPLGSLTYVWTMFLSHWYLREKVDAWQWAGVGLIIVGVTLVYF